MRIAAAVKDLATLDAAGNKRVAGGFDVGDDQVQALRGAGLGRRDVPAEDDRGIRARRGELDHPPVATGGEVGVEPPAELCVKRLGAIDVGYRHDDDFELEIDAAQFRGSLAV